MSNVFGFDRFSSRLRGVLSVAGIAVAVACLASPTAQAAQRVKVSPGFNGSVLALAGPDANGVTYLGGSFTAFNALDTGYGTLVNDSTGVVNTSFPKVSGGSSGIFAVAPDGSGGFYIGGDFTSVDGVTRNRAARINADGSLADWNPNLSGTVNAIAVSGSSVYLGGTFSGANSVNGSTTRNRATKVDTTNGTVDPNWDPNISGAVYALAVDGSSVYLGGNFATVNGSTTRNRAAKVDTTNGTVDPNWNPNLNSFVNALAVSGSSVYIGGAFSGANSVNGNTTRNRAAKVDTTNGTVDTNWNPNISNIVNELAVSGSSVYIGGQFNGANSVNGNTTRNRAAKVDATTGNVDANWNPNLIGVVSAIAVSGSSVYLGGQFSGANSVNGTTTLNRAAKVDTTNGTVDANWNANLNSSVYALAVSGSSVYLGGAFSSAGGIVRNRAAAFDSSGNLTSWNPNLNGTVNSLAVDGSSVYLGGAFSGANSVNGSTTRNRAAKVDTINGTVDSSWDPNLNGTVQAIVVSGSSVYLGGVFGSTNSVNGNTTRNYAAKVDTTNGTVDSSWNPNLNNNVNALAVSGSSVYLGGAFNGTNSVNGNTTRNRAAKVDTTSGTVDSSWNPNLSSTVNAIAVSGSSVYIGGLFNGTNSVNGNTTRNRAAKVDTTNGTVNSSWNPNLSSSVNALAVSGSSVYLGGTFNGANSVNGTTTRNRAAKVDTTNGTVDSNWNANLNATVNALAVSGSSVYLGGDFSGANSVNGTTALNDAARVDTTNGTVGSWGLAMPSPTLNTNTASVDRGAVVKSDATAGTGSTPGTYQWQRCTSSNTADCSDIVGGGSNGAWWGSRNADIGNRVRVKTVWDTIDSTLTSYSALTGLFTPASTTAPAIDQGLVSGAPKVGTKIHTSFGVWGGYIAGSSTISFQWQRCTTTDASSCTTNIGTNSQWYTPVTADAGNYLRVTATLTTNGQTATASSAISGVVASATQARRSVAKTAVAKTKAGKVGSRR